MSLAAWWRVLALQARVLRGKMPCSPCTFGAMILGKDSCPLCIACMGVRHAQVTLANLKHCPHFPFFRQGFWREECGWRPLIKVTPPFLLRPRWRPNSHLCFAAGASLWMKSPPSFLLFSRSRQRKGKSDHPSVGGGRGWRCDSTIDSLPAGKRAKWRVPSLGSGGA